MSNSRRNSTAVGARTIGCLNFSEQELAISHKNPPRLGREDRRFMDTITQGHALSGKPPCCVEQVGEASALLHDSLRYARQPNFPSILFSNF